MISMPSVFRAASRIDGMVRGKKQIALSTGTITVMLTGVRQLLWSRDSKALVHEILSQPFHFAERRLHVRSLKVCQAKDEPPSRGEGAEILSPALPNTGMQVRRVLVTAYRPIRVVENPTLSQ